MILDLIVFASMVFAVVFLAAWLALPNLRAWIERPKYRFQANVQSYDKVQVTRWNRGERSESK